MSCGKTSKSVLPTASASVLHPRFFQVGRIGHDLARTTILGVDAIRHVFNHRAQQITFFHQFCLHFLLLGDVVTDADQADDFPGGIAPGDFCGEQLSDFAIRSDKFFFAVDDGDALPKHLLIVLVKFRGNIFWKKLKVRLIQRLGLGFASQVLQSAGLATVLRAVLSLA